MVEKKVKKSPKKLQIIYRCECCDYSCSVKGNYDKHLTTRKHQIFHFGGVGGVEKSPKKLQTFNCESCDYTSCKRNEYNKHIATPKHLNNMLAKIKSPKKLQTFYCDKCASTCSSKYSFERHLLTPKHLNKKGEKGAEKSPKKVFHSNKIYPCRFCGKEYVGAYGLDRHRRLVHADMRVPDTTDSSELVHRLCTRNDELYQTIVDISKKLQPQSIVTTTNSNNTTNIHNKTFNLNFFLNETCKNAMNISEFIETINVSLCELEKAGETGFVRGISDIITTKLNGLALTERPIHCSDLKRETMYVKDEDAWAKEPGGNPKIKNLIQHVSHKNLGTLGEWKKAHPDCLNPLKHDSNRYQSLVAMACSLSSDATDGNIIRRVAKQVVIGKDRELG